jgi:hypothetical protein
LYRSLLLLLLLCQAFTWQLYNQQQVSLSSNASSS